MFAWILIIMMVLLFIGTAKILITSGYQIYNKYFSTISEGKPGHLNKSIEV